MKSIDAIYTSCWVAKSIIYHDDKDFLKFLEIMQDASQEQGEGVNRLVKT